MTLNLQAIKARAAAGGAKIVLKEKHRIECHCGELAVIQHGYVMPDSRKRSAWGSDFDLHQCADCNEKDDETHVPHGHKWANSFEFGERFEHLFYEWQETDASALIAEVERLREENTRLKKELPADAFWEDVW